MTAAALVEWRASMRESRAALRTMNLRIQTVECLLRHAGKTDPVALTREDVAAYMARPVKPWTAATYLKCIRAWDAWSQQSGYTSVSITESIEVPRTPATRTRPLTDSEARALLAARPLLGRALRR